MGDETAGRDGRRVRYVRVSITDRCNLRCTYCSPQPAGGAARDDLLSYEDITAVVTAAAALGVTKVRVTGGEPLARRGVGRLLQMLSAVDGPTDLALTTNGTRLRERLGDLTASRFGRVNVSLDTMSRARFRDLTGVDGLLRVLAGVDAAVAAGLRVKLNAVCVPGLTVDDALALARFGLSRGADVRFIEAMPVAGALAAERGVARGIEQGLVEALALRPAGREGVARLFERPGEPTRLGFITPSHDRFCQGCDKLRLSSRGVLRTCLFATRGVELRPLLRAGDGDALRSAVKDAIEHKEAAAGREGAEVCTMVGIGG